MHVFVGHVGGYKTILLVEKRFYWLARGMLLKPFFNIHVLILEGQENKQLTFCNRLLEL